MNTTNKTDMKTDRLIEDLDKFARVRADVADSLGHIAKIIDEGEKQSDRNSGKLGLERDIEDIRSASKNLRSGVFRLLVLGDMKRGKSTFLNALIGERLLPSDVNPCTAVLTILRYGAEKRVTVHFTNDSGKSPEVLNFDSFKQKYTIDPAEAKRLETEKKLAFPDVSHAIVEYPLALLEKGVEIIDSPGLNDTEARNELSLGYINNCHAILFVLRASQPCTLGERRYLENYIKGRGLSVFFLVNAWDQVKEALIDPEDQDELREAEARLRQVFQSNLAEYCIVDGQDIYNERVFEISSIQALRKRLKNPDASLEGTGFTKFIQSLNTFLTRERAVAELRQIRTLARQAGTRTREAIERRIPLLEKDVAELRDRISSVEPEFRKLSSIRDQFQADILQMRDNQAHLVAESFRSYVLGLGDTFETDFLKYQPELNLFDFLNGGKREAFNTELQKAFEQYVGDKFAAWSLTAEKDINMAFMQLSRSAEKYGASYSQVTSKITEKMTGNTVKIKGGLGEEEDSPSWAKWAMGLLSLSSGNFAGFAMAGVGFDWKNILLNYFTVVGVGALLGSVTGILLGPISLALLGLGVGFLQADQGRKQLVKTAKKELVKHLPQVANEQSQNVYKAVKECFDTYEREVRDRIDDDIKARKAELDNLLQQKETREINKEAELTRLKQLEHDVVEEVKNIETAYSCLLAAYG